MWKQQQQGDQDGVKGVYHINAVDCVTQWELVATCEKISEAYLLPVIETLLAGFPFRILGFHADNGSEYINHKVARLLDKLSAEFTKSRPRHSNDNGLAETRHVFLGGNDLPARYDQLNRERRQIRKRPRRYNWLSNPLLPGNP